VLRESVSVALTQHPDATYLMLATGTRMPVDHNFVDQLLQEIRDDDRDVVSCYSSRQRRAALSQSAETLDVNLRLHVQFMRRGY
jgi:hypothetical protein